MKSIVLDTSYLTTDNRDPVIISNKLQKLTQEYLVYITPSTWNEIQEFISMNIHLDNFIIRNYDLASSIPSFFMDYIVKQYRKGVNKAIKYACQSVTNVYRMQPKSPVPGKPHPTTEIVNTLRQKLRDHLRGDKLDSEADVTSLLLSYQLNIPLATKDQGLMKSAIRLGVCIHPY